MTTIVDTPFTIAQADKKTKADWVAATVVAIMASYIHDDNMCGHLLMQLGTLLVYGRCNVTDTYIDFWAGQGCLVTDHTGVNWGVVHAPTFTI